jgi:hypothetical protein
MTRVPYENFISTLSTIFEFNDMSTSLRFDTSLSDLYARPTTGAYRDKYFPNCQFKVGYGVHAPLPGSTQVVQTYIGDSRRSGLPSELNPT